MLTGPDISHHQGDVDWAKVRAAGHRYAFCKATEGATFRDSRFGTNWPAMRAAGLVRGAYHFLRTGTDPRAQARHYLAVVGDLTGSMAALDVERSASGTNPTAAEARAFVDEFRARTGGHPIVIYTGRWYWQGVLGNPHGADLGPLWHSAYSSRPGALYGGWDRFTFWQHTSSGSCPGVAGRCDLNQFFGDELDLAALTGASLQEDDMPLSNDDLEKIEGKVREVLNEGTGQGQSTWAGTSKATLATAQAAINKLNAIAGAVGQLDDVDEAELARQLLPGILQAVGAEAFAEAIAEALGPDLARVWLDEFARALATRPTEPPAPPAGPS